MHEHNNLEEFQDPLNYDLEETDRAAQRIQFFVDLALTTGGPALELACGSGIVSLPIAARGIPIIGIDLARPMLAHARLKAERQQLPVVLFEADARQFHLKKKFPLILLTGNAFQAFLHRRDQEQLLAAVRCHLAPNGFFAFETRNPSGHDLSDHPEEEHWFTYTNVQEQTVTVSGTQLYNPLTQTMCWTTYRRWIDSKENYSSVTRIACRFTYPQELEALLYSNGFRITAQYGDWNKVDLTARSEHIISICQHQ